MVSHLDATNNNGIWKKTAFCGCCRVPGIVWGAQMRDFLGASRFSQHRYPPGKNRGLWPSHGAGRCVRCAKRRFSEECLGRLACTDSIEKSAFCGNCRVPGVMWGAREGGFLR